MQRPVFALVTINGQKGIGPRYVKAACEAAGVESHLIHFKLFESRHVSYDEGRRLRAASKLFVARIHTDGEEVIPYPHAVTEEEVELLVEELRRISPTLVGLSFASVDLDTAILLTDTIHTRFAGLPVMWGGIHTILNPDTAIAHADIVCTGEGDEVIVEYLAAPSRRDIPGLWYNDGGQITRNPMRPLIRDLDRLAFPAFGINEISIDNGHVDREISDVATAINRFYQIVTSRGCPFACSYCLHRQLRNLYKGQKYLRRRSVENVMRELELRGSQGFFACSVDFYDEVLLKDPEWMEEFAREYGRRVGLPFAGYGHEMFTTPEMVRQLRDAGMMGMALAFQSGSRRMCVDIYRRPVNEERFLKLAWQLAELKLDIIVIEGLTNTPFETEEDTRMTLELLLKLPTPFHLHMCKLMIFPGTTIEKTPPLENPLSEESFHFWNMLYLMCQCERLPRETIRSLADDPYLRANPAVLEKLVNALVPLADPEMDVAIRLGPRSLEIQKARRAAATPVHNNGRLRRLLRRVKNRIVR